MAAESGIGTVKEKIRTLRKEKAQVQDSGAREILRQRIRRLKKKTRKLSRQAGLQVQNAATAEAVASAEAEPAAPEPEGPKSED